MTRRKEISSDLAVAMRQDPAIAREVAAIDVEIALREAEEAYHRATGRTRYQFIIGLVDVIAMRFVMMDQERRAKRLFRAHADQFNSRDSASYRRAKRRERRVVAELEASVADRPHRRSPRA